MTLLVDIMLVPERQVQGGCAMSSVSACCIPAGRRPFREGRIGGLGVFIVKKKMDGMHYEYKIGMNVLTIRKNLRPVLPL